MEKRKVPPKKLLYSGIYEKWHEKTFDDFDNDQEAKEAVIKVLKEETQKGMFLYGDPGVGKTLLLNVSMKQKLLEGNLVYVLPPDMLLDAYLKRGSDDRFKSIRLCHYLGIDDLTKHYVINPKSVELLLTALDNVIRYRVQRLKPTWITSNYGPKKTTDLFGAGFGSLLSEACYIQQITGVDKRKGGEHVD